MPQTARHAFKVVAALTEPWILLCCTRRYQKSHDCHWNTLNTCILATPFQPLHWHSLDLTHSPFLTYMTVHNCLILTENGQHSPPRLEPWRRVWAWLAWPVYRARPTCRAWPTCRARSGWLLWASLWCLWWPGINMFFDDFLISSLSGQNKKSGSNQGTSQSFKIKMISVFLFLPMIFWPGQVESSTKLCWSFLCPRFLAQGSLCQTLARMPPRRISSLSFFWMNANLSENWKI